MIYVQAQNMTLTQKVIIFILLAAFLIGGFFIAMALLPLILVFIVYLWYKFRQTAKKIRQAQEEMYNSAGFQDNFGNYQQDFHGNFLGSEQFSEESKTYSQESKDVYDISPDDYTIEDKNSPK